MRVLTVAGAKGGTTKTTTALILAGILASRFDVALRDLDPQASATLALGQDPARDPWSAGPLRIDAGEGAFDLYRGGRTIEQGAASVVTCERPPDLLILDTPPALDTLTVKALASADLVLVPLEPSPLQIPALSDVMALLASFPNPPEVMSILTRVNPRRILTRDVTEQLASLYGDVLHRSTIVPEDVRIAEAPGYGVLPHCHAPQSKVITQYRVIAETLCRKLGLTYTSTPV
jgi:chromosome partitioning protein